MVGLCRLCASLKKPDLLINIHDSADKICEKLQKCCSVHIEVNDDTMPKSVCCSCLQKLNNCYEFYTRVQEAQETLKALFPEQERSSEGQNILENALDDVSTTVAEEDVKVSSPERTEMQMRRRSQAGNTKCNKIIITKQETLKSFYVPSGQKNKKDENKMKTADKRGNSKTANKNHKKLPKRHVKIEIVPSVVNAAQDREENSSGDGYLQEVYRILGMTSDDLGQSIVLEEHESYNGGEQSNRLSHGEEMDNGNEDSDVQIKEQYSLETNEVEEIILDEAYEVDEGEEEEVEMQYTQIKGDHEESNHEAAIQSNIISWRQYNYQCALCNKQTHNYEELFQHAVNNHSIEDKNKMHFKCTDCHKLIEHYNDFINHIRIKHHPALKLRCDGCDLSCKSNGQYEMHRDYECDSSKRLPKILTCSCCCKAFRSFAGRQVHMKHQGIKIEHSTKVEYPCDQCPEVFASQNDLKLHGKNHRSKVETLSCDICEKFFLGKAALAAHIGTHLTNQTYQCKVCPKEFKSLSYFENHKMTHKEKEKPFHCTFCDRQFRTKVEQVTHERVHTGEMPLQCNLCDKRFRFRSALAAHMKTHSGVRLYTCSFCLREFNDISNFKKHVKRKHADESSNPMLSSEKIKNPL